jgi:hypothetical protein
MLTSFYSTHQHSPVVRYVGDTETGVVHRVGSDCEVITVEVFLDVRTAIVRGYQLCSCCRTSQ